MATRFVYFNSRPSARGDLRVALLNLPLRISIHAPPRGATRCLSPGASRVKYFNSRPSARGVVKAFLDGGSVRLFQFTPLREGRLGGGGGAVPHCGISIHAPPRGATVSPDSEGKLYIFQFTPLREGRRGLRRISASGWIFQFTPLREGRPVDVITFGSPCQISIHAPPRGATGQARGNGARDCISIHAPPRGATTGMGRSAATTCYFNSRPSARGDADADVVFQRFHEFQFTPLREGRRVRYPARQRVRKISIHAPPRGATCRIASGFLCA